MILYDPLCLSSYRLYHQNTHSRYDSDTKNTSNLGRSAWIDVEHAPSSSRTSDDEALHRLRKVALQKAFLVKQGKVGFNGRGKKANLWKTRDDVYMYVYMLYIYIYIYLCTSNMYRYIC